MQIMTVNFASDQQGTLHLPEHSRGVAIFAHCFTCADDSAASRTIPQRLAEHGVATLRFDFSGDYQEQMTALRGAVAYLKSRDLVVDTLVGHGLGGTAVLDIAKEIDGLHAVATVGAHFRDGLAPSAPVLLLHSTSDDDVALSEAEQLRVALGTTTSLMILDGVDHHITQASDARYVADLIAPWLARRLDASGETPREGEADVVVESVDGTAYLTEVRAGHNTTFADEPLAHGGTDLGMAPYELLQAGLGACTSMTLFMYARRKKWPLRNVRVELVADRIGAETSENHQDKEGAKVLQIQRNIRVRGELDDAQRARLLEIANKCPVHRSLSGPIEILSFLDEQA